MEKLKVPIKTNPYDIVFGQDVFGRIKEVIKDRKAFVITDSNVEKLHFDRLKAELGELNCYVIPAGENSKNIQTVQDIIGAMLEAGVKRNDVVLAFGGGVPCDIAGFVASCYMRGIDYIQIPTTLLAMVDSSIGGKTGVDFNGVKNIVGAFHQPKLVAVNVDFLSTLAEKEWFCGFGECVKYALLEGNIFEFVCKNKELILKRDSNIIFQLIKLCAGYKAYIVSSDEKESGLRKVLNLGHTLGHGLETLQAGGENVSHGEYVSNGLLMELFISLKLGYIQNPYYDACVNLIKNFLFSKIDKVDVEQFLKVMACDKKNTSSKISVILPCEKSVVNEMHISKELLTEFIGEFYAN